MYGFGWWNKEWLLLFYYSDAWTEQLRNVLSSGASGTNNGARRRTMRLSDIILKVCEGWSELLHMQSQVRHEKRYLRKGWKADPRDGRLKLLHIPSYVR